MLVPFAYGYMTFGMLSGIYGASITGLSMTVVWTVAKYNSMRDRCLLLQSREIVDLFPKYHDE